MRKLLILALSLLFMPAAYAHSGDHVGGFVHGLEHPIGGLDHVLAMVAVGVFAFVLGGRALFVVPLSFVVVMVGGFLVAQLDIALPGIETGIAVSSIVIGAAAALALRMPTLVAATVVGVFGFFHGYAHGAEMPASGDGLAYAAGFILATAALHLAGIAAAYAGAKFVGGIEAPIARLIGAALAAGGTALMVGWL